MKEDQKFETYKEDDSFQESWTLESALRILKHPTVDAKIWAEAVEWLLLHGPEEIREHLLKASLYATGKHFPGLKTAGCNTEGEVCYSIEEIARQLDIDIDEARSIIEEKERSHNRRHGFTEDETTKLQ